MATQITWIIEWMQSKPVENNLQDVVITAGWRCNGVDGEYFTTVYGSCSFPAPGTPFTPYDQLTEQQVLGWCWDNGVDKLATEADIEGQIQNQINPPIVQLPLPWQA
jgi:hypothetical protein